MGYIEKKVKKELHIEKNTKFTAYEKIDSSTFQEIDISPIEDILISALSETVHFQDPITLSKSPYYAPLVPYIERIVFMMVEVPKDIVTDVRNSLWRMANGPYLGTADCDYNPSFAVFYNSWIFLKENEDKAILLQQFKG